MKRLRGNVFGLQSSNLKYDPSLGYIGCLPPKDCARQHCGKYQKSMGDVVVA